MNLDNLLNNVSRTDIARAFGLGPRFRDFFWPALGLFSTGALLGVGAALLFAPKSGAKLRGDISDEVRSKLEELGQRLERFASNQQRQRREEEGESEAQAA